MIGKPCDTSPTVDDAQPPPSAGFHTKGHSSALAAGHAPPARRQPRRFEKGLSPNGLFSSPISGGLEGGCDEPVMCASMRVHCTSGSPIEVGSSDSEEEAPRLCSELHEICGGMFGCMLPAGHTGEHFSSIRRKRERNETKRFEVPGADVPQSAQKAWKPRSVDKAQKAPRTDEVPLPQAPSAYQMDTTSPQEGRLATAEVVLGQPSSGTAATLPPGWTLVSCGAAQNKYKRYLSPVGIKVLSAAEAWRMHAEVEKASAAGRSVVTTQTAPETTPPPPSMLTRHRDHVPSSLVATVAVEAPSCTATTQMEQDDDGCEACAGKHKAHTCTKRTKRSCQECGASKSPKWRYDMSLCNKCGLARSKRESRPEEDHEEQSAHEEEVGKDAISEVSKLAVERAASAKSPSRIYKS